MATEIGSLLIDMRADVARLSQDMAKAQSTVEGAMNKVKSSAAAAVTALGLIGVGVSVAGMANVVKGAVGAMAALDDMAAKAGTTVENMSALADVAKIGGHDLGVVEGAMVRLTKALAGGDDEAKGAGHALAALGLNAEKLRGMDTAEAMLEVAKALAKFENGAGKTALMLDLLGKSGAAAIPYFEDLAEKGELVAKVTAQQAAEAEKLEKEMGKLKVMSADTARSMANEMVPAMLKFVEQLVEGKKIAGGWVSAMWEFGVLLDPFKGIPQNLNETREALEKLHAEMAKGMAQNLADGGQTDLSEVDKKIQMLERRKKFLDFQQRQEVESKYTGPQFLDARDLAARQKESLAGYTSKDKKDGKPAPKTPLQKMIELGERNLAASKAKEYVAVDDDEEARQGAQKREMESLKWQGKQAEELEKLRQKYVAMADPLQQYRVQLDEINLLREKGVLTADQALEAEWAVNEAMDKSIDKLGEVKDAGKDTFAELTSVIEAWGNKAADTFADFVVDGKGSFSDLINSMLKDIVRLQAKQMLDPITKGAGGFLTDIVKGLFGGTTAAVQHGGGIVGFEQAGFRDLSPAIFSGAPRLHGGGIAGDEMPAVLQKGEGVFTRGQMAALGGGAGTRITVNLIENNSKAGQVQQRNEGGVNVLDIFVDRIKSAIASDIADGRGGIPAALQTSYGLNRAPGGY